MTSDDKSVSDDRLREIIAGCKGVTPGPWEVGIPGDYPPSSCLDGDFTPIHSDKWGAFVSVVINSTRYGGRVESSEVGVTNAAHIARLDPQTVAAICSELLSRRSHQEGWQLVPAEPTEAMLRASFNNPAYALMPEGDAKNAGIYRAMLAAAPTPKAMEA